MSLRTSVSRVRRTCAAKPLSECGRDAIEIRFPLFVRVREMDGLGLRVVDADVDVRLVEDLADLVAHRVVDPLHVELGGERLLDAVDDRELGRALLALLEQALRLVEEPRVLQRDAHAVGERLQQAHVRIAVRVLALRVGQADEPARLVADDQRYVHRRLLVRGAREREASVLFGFALHVLVDDERLACAQHVRGKALVEQRTRIDLDALSVLVDIRKVDKLRLRIVDPDSHVGVVEDLADLVADRVVDSLHVELGGERMLNARDDRELGRALLLGLEQPLRLVEEARVLERDGHRIGERGQQTHVGVGERVLPVAVERDDADRLVALQDRARRRS